jgi:hypothetical protein
VRYRYVFLVALILLSGYSGAQTPSQKKTQSPKAEPAPEEIIQKFAQKETEFYEAWMQYAYTQRATIRILEVNGEPQKETMTIVSEVVFNDDGTREVRTIQRSGRLRSVQFTPEDQEIIDNINPFAITTKDLGLYNLKYLGKERVDELDCYVFSVDPKSTKGKRLYFQGKIWVDDIDLQIVRTIGKAVPQTRDNQFPRFETIRQMIDNKHWFPVWTHAKSVLEWPGKSVNIEETVTYEDYKKFTSKSRILEGTEAPADSE